MNKYTKYTGWACLFLIISCSNLSNLCRHQFGAGTAFTYKEDGGIAPSFTSWVQTTAFMPEEAGRPARLHWDTLKDVTFELRFSKEYQIDINYPIFGNSVKKFSGKEVYITGYMIPLNPSAGFYALSKTNFASCFFCGRAGPESVISLKFKKTPRQYKTDEYLTLKGRLELNGSNIYDFIYIFRDTEEFKAR